MCATSAGSCTQPQPFDGHHARLLLPVGQILAEQRSVLGQANPRERVEGRPRLLAPLVEREPLAESRRRSLLAQPSERIARPQADAHVAVVQRRHHRIGNIGRR